MKRASKASASLYAFVLVLLAFPFLSVSCNGQKVFEFSGYEMVMGAEMINPIDGSVDKANPNLPLALTVIAAVAAAVATWKGRHHLSAILALASMAGLMYFGLNMWTQAQGQSDPSIVVRVHFAAAYWLSYLTLLAGMLVPHYLFRESPQQLETRAAPGTLSRPEPPTG